MPDTPAALEDRFTTVAGLNIRYLEQGQGPPAVLIHGASLGSSADVWRRNLGPLASYGIRTIAYDQPGFGLSDDAPDWSLSHRTAFIAKFLDALDLRNAALVGHSQAGAMVVDLALSSPDRVRRVVVLGTGSLLPPTADRSDKKSGPAEGEEGADREPTIGESRTALAANLSDHTLITDEELAIRHRMSLGKNFRAFLARNRAAAETRSSGDKGKPVWQRLTQMRQPLLMIYGRDDRGEASRRAAAAKEQYPALDLHIVPNCKHIVQWDAAEEFHRLAGPFLRD